MRDSYSNNPIAMAYVPIQQWSTLYEPVKALHCGTAFPELNLKFCGRRER
ncbi:MAG: spore coat associated protein CotJA [Lachnospiraceae bacterium]|nr:spore coat associated protein CotJA [Lachnospiraceae bacterium]